MKGGRRNRTRRRRRNRNRSISNYARKYTRLEVNRLEEID